MDVALPRAAEPDRLARESLTRRMSRDEGETIQSELAGRIRQRGLVMQQVRHVVGAVCVDADDGLFAAAVVLAFPGLELVEASDARGTAKMPYASGVRAFREGAVVMEAVERLKSRPDVIFFQGHGIAHPRGCGLASHLGLALGLPSIGCARRRIGAVRDAAPLSAGEPGDCKPLTNGEGRPIGAAVVTRPGSRPLLVSVGHLIDLGTAVALTLACSGGHVMPEPLRAADAAARAARRAAISAAR
jgi:deoxyribonuclease V